MPNEPTFSAARERVRGIVRRTQPVRPTDTLPVVSYEVWSKVAEDVATMQNGWLVRDVAFESHRGRLGPVVERSKRTLLRMLHPFPQRQSEYNLAVNRILTHLLEINHRQAIAIERLQEQIDDLAHDGDNADQ